MAIVRTTSKETNTSGGTPPDRNGDTSATPKVVDRTKSVVNPGGISVRPVPRTPGVRASAPATPRRSGTFVQETRSELQKVVWPSREEVRSGTIVTILLLVVFGAYIFGLDAFFSWLFHALNLYPEISSGS
jgi:preprotein translocase subunit SecE